MTVAPESLLDRLESLLARPAALASEEWLLVATLLVEAAEALGPATPDPSRARFERIRGELCDLTDGFTRPLFVRSTRAARRHRPELFAPSRAIRPSA